MKLVYILTIAFIIVIACIMRAFGAVVGAGGNLPKIISQTQKMLRKPDRNINEVDEDNDMQKKPASQIYRTIAGILFSILILYPFIMFGHESATEISPKYAIEISLEWRLIIFVLLIITEAVLFLIIRKKDRDDHQNIADTHVDDNKTPRA